MSKALSHFLIGAGSAFGLFPQKRPLRSAALLGRSDAQNLAQDWIRIGQHIHRATVKTTSLLEKGRKLNRVGKDYGQGEQDNSATQRCTVETPCGSG